MYAILWGTESWAPGGDAGGAGAGVLVEMFYRA